MGAIHAGGNTKGRVTENVACEDIDGPENDDQDSRGDDDAPEGYAKRFLACGFFIQIPKDRDADNNHCDPKSNETGRRGVERPVPRNIIAK